MTHFVFSHLSNFDSFCTPCYEHRRLRKRPLRHLGKKTDKHMNKKRIIYTNLIFFYSTMDLWISKNICLGFLSGNSKNVVKSENIRWDRSAHHTLKSLTLWEVKFSNSFFYNSETRFGLLSKNCLHKVVFFLKNI